MPRDASLWADLYGDVTSWDTTDHLLAAVVDLLAAGNWQRGGGKRARPRPVERPRSRDRRRRVKPSMSQDEVRAWLAARKPPKKEVADG